MKSGIEKLLETQQGPHIQYCLADDSTWTYWASRRDAQLWQLVALHSHLDPALLVDWSWVRDGAERYHTLTNAPLELTSRLWANVQTAVWAAEDFDLPVATLHPTTAELHIVAIADFHAWATRASLEPVEGFISRSGAQGGQFPWGSYTTPRLEQLAKACELWRLKTDGGAYDPMQPWTAPHPDDVRRKLTELRVPTSQQEILASMMRDPRLPFGRRQSPPRKD